MGNKIGRRRQVVDERYTQPQGLYHHKDVDHKKLRKLILDAKLAPCYPGDDDPTFDLEECPICFLYYPSLNRSRCCMKGICTECFLQMKPPHSTRPTQCPFCKTSKYAVEYRGVRSKEEKGMEQLEQQRVIEAQIRMRQQELREDEQQMQKRHEIISSSRMMPPDEVGCQDTPSSLSVPSLRCQASVDELDASHSSCVMPTSTRSLQSTQNRDANFDLDLEDIMVMEAIWLSIQEHGPQRPPNCSGSASAGTSSSEECYTTHVMVPSETSPSGGLACAVASLAERQHLNSIDSVNVASSSTPAFNTLPPSLAAGGTRHTNYQNFSQGNWTGMSPELESTHMPREESTWAVMDQRSDMAEVGTSYASSEVALDSTSAASPPRQEGTYTVSGHQLVPESFEEQMMLAMAVSLAEARARTTPQGLTWM